VELDQSFVSSYQKVGAGLPKGKDTSTTIDLVRSETDIEGRARAPAMKLIGAVQEVLQGAWAKVLQLVDRHHDYTIEDEVPIHEEKARSLELAEQAVVMVEDLSVVETNGAVFDVREDEQEQQLPSKEQLQSKSGYVGRCPDPRGGPSRARRW